MPTTLRIARYSLRKIRETLIKNEPGHKWMEFQSQFYFQHYFKTTWCHFRKK